MTPGRAALLDFQWAAPEQAEPSSDRWYGWSKSDEVGLRMQMTRNCTVFSLTQVEGWHSSAVKGSNAFEILKLECSTRSRWLKHVKAFKAWEVNRKLLLGENRPLLYCSAGSATPLLLLPWGSSCGLRVAASWTRPTQLYIDSRHWKSKTARFQSA